MVFNALYLPDLLFGGAVGGLCACVRGGGDGGGRPLLFNTLLRKRTPFSILRVGAGSLVVCAVFTLNRYFCPTTFSAPSVRSDVFNLREIVRMECPP